MIWVQSSFFVSAYVYSPSHLCVCELLILSDVHLMSSSQCMTGHWTVELSFRSADAHIVVVLSSLIPNILVSLDGVGPSYYGEKRA